MFDDAGMVTQTVDGGNDIGKDLYVDLTEDGRVTGQLIAVQVKSGASYRRASGYAIPCDGGDIALWADTSVPIFGIVFDPESEQLRWINLTAWARSLATAEVPNSAPVSDLWSLSERTLPEFLAQARSFLEASGPPVLIGLFDSDPLVQMQAIYDALALGRQDARALLLLRASVRWLDRRALRLAIQVLTLCEGHGDIFWTAGNWIEEPIKRVVRGRFDWSYEELCALLGAAEADEWHRGGMGQNVDALLGASRRHDSARQALREVIRRAPEDLAWPALIHLTSQSDNAAALTAELLQTSVSLRGSDLAHELQRTVEQFGNVSAW